MELCCETSFSIFNLVIANDVTIKNKKLVMNPPIFNEIKLLSNEMNADIAVNFLNSMISLQSTFKLKTDIDAIFKILHGKLPPTFHITMAIAMITMYLMGIIYIPMVTIQFLNMDIAAFAIPYTLPVNTLHTSVKICEILCHLSVPFLVLTAPE